MIRAAVLQEAAEARLLFLPSPRKQFSYDCILSMVGEVRETPTENVLNFNPPHLIGIGKGGQALHRAGRVDR